jgi:DNA-directed RNA polymerase specialized sigma24 family protein
MDLILKTAIQKIRLDGSSYSQISSVIGISLNTVKSFYIRNKLQDLKINESKIK